MIALILGGAPSWREEAKAAALLLDRRHLIVAANWAGVHWRGQLHAHATLHPEHLAEWRAARRVPADRYFVPAGLHALPWAEKAADRWNGSSGLYAAQVALFEVGATAVIFCGVPMDSEAGHFTRPPGASWEGTSDYRLGFEAALRECGGRVRSMGGWTADLFGQPTSTWAASVENIKRLGASDPPHARTEQMHKITNTGRSTATFWAPDESGQRKLHRLGPGESTTADIDPDQPKFQGGDLRVSGGSEPRARKSAPKKTAARKPAPKKPAAPAAPASTDA